MPTTLILFLSLFFTFRTVTSNRAFAFFKAEYKLLTSSWGSWFEVWGEKRELYIGGKREDELTSIKKAEREKEISGIFNIDVNIEDLIRGGVPLIGSPK